MKVIYQAENSIDANLLKNLLEQAGIMAFINGEFLQGGIGELPTGGLISVSVANPDLEAALTVVDELKQNTDHAPVEGETRWDPVDQLLDWK
jgi:hypothetical protein